MRSVLSFTHWLNKQFVIRSLKKGSGYAHKTNLSMDKAFVRSTAGSPEVHISFRYQNSSYNIDRDFNFCRKLDEKVDDVISRMRINIEKEFMKKEKKKLKKEQGQCTQLLPIQFQNDCVQFFRNGNKVDLADLTFTELMNDPRDLQLRVIDRTYEVLLNHPWVINLVLPTLIMADFQIYPSKVEMQFAERELCKAVWYKAPMPQHGNVKNAIWSKCDEEGFLCKIEKSDIGCLLKFVLTPADSMGRSGPYAESISKNAVQAFPCECPFERRHTFTTRRLAGDAFRIMSYNLLADMYADSDYSRTHLFPYCPPHALKIEYRKQLFIKEIVGYNADIVCLQEVDMKIFDYDLNFVLASPELKYKGLIEQKGKAGEGIAIFYRVDRFEMIRTFGVNIGENIGTSPIFADIWKQVSDNEQFVERICNRSTTVQVCVLKSKDNGRYLLVANTHLYFHPDADHVRLMQIGFAMRYLEHAHRSLMDELGLERDDIAVLFCGDFNSSPGNGIYQLMTSNSVGSDIVDWSSNKDERVHDVCLKQPFTMGSACGTPPFTNFTHDFADCLDYIFYERDRLTVEQFVPLPSVEELSEHTAIPSLVFPSDHVALVADLRFKSTAPMKDLKEEGKYNT